MADLRNFKRHAKPNTVLVMDDLNCAPHWWCTDPQKAWDEMKAAGEIVETKAYRWKQVDPTAVFNRGFSVGRYASA
jgi:hypothetical protein